MKSKILFALIFTNILLFCKAQDVIVMTNGDELNAKVIEISDSEIKCKQTDVTGDLVRIIPKNEVFMIKYENGNKEIITSNNNQNQGNNAVGNATNTQNKNEDYFALGQTDAMRYYTGQNSGAVWTGVTACACGPIIGLIPAAACASTKPLPQNMYMPNPALAKNTEYNSGYTSQAHKIKKRKVWTGYGIGSVFAIFFAVLSLAA